MPSTFNARDAEAYERVMGRWSRRLAAPFLDFAGVATGSYLDERGGNHTVTVTWTGCGAHTVVQAN